MLQNILLAGMGGQGLVLMTKIICQAGIDAGYEVKSNDVVGLSQRGGMVWGNVKIGKKVHSPNIKVQQGDFLVAMEPLEAKRWEYMLKKSGTIILNNKRINPVLVQQEVVDYPEKEIKALVEVYETIQVNAFNEAVNIGKPQVANVIMIGILAKALEATPLTIERECWEQAIIDNVPKKAIEMNKKAFQKGLSY